MCSAELKAHALMTAASNKQTWPADQECTMDVGKLSLSSTFTLSSHCDVFVCMPVLH